MMLNKVSLNTIGLNRIGLNRIGKPSRGSSDRPYIDPEVLASLKAVCICYGKSNDDPDRAVVKNLVDPDNPFVISNAAFKLNSGFGKYEVDFTVYNNQNVLVSPNKIVSIAGREFISLLPYTELSKTISSYKIKVTGLIGEFSYWYRNQDGSESRIIITKDGIYQLSTCYNVENGQGSSVGFNGYSESSCTIEQIPSFEGAFVTDGIDDTIISTKTLAEMGITDEVTVVSMIHQIALNPTYNLGTTNYLENLDNGKHIRSDVYYADKTGIYGYTASLINNTASDIKNILGDKADYSTKKDEPSQTLHNSKFSVVGRARNFNECSSVAWYWTIIANKVLTTDQINQVIAYFNLDRTLKPDILCNVKKQGITNENHAEFGDKLIDFSGNGRDIQLNNIAWNKESGIDDNGALCLDGVNDFGQFVGDLGLKDYTFIMDREYLSLKADQVPVISSINPSTDTPFIFEHCVYEGKVARPFSFGKDTVFEEQLVSKRFISYQSTYKYNGKDISKGTYVNTGSGLTIGRYGDDKQYANFALYFLMSFPYSMSEFLIERQLKKYKLGTLYPNMVEFRPIIKHDDRITAIRYYHIKGSSWVNLKPGDYIPVGSKISITTNLKSPYTIANVVSSSLTDIKVVPSAGGGNAYDTLGYVTDKSPQKITIDIQVDSSLVQWNPVVESNVPYKSVKYYKLVDTSWKAINVGDYVLVGQRILTQITTVGIEDEVVAAVSEQLDIYGINKNSNGEYNILGITSSTTPQNINITIDEYIRYEDIVQPYPVLLRFNDENGNEVSWGGKFKVGSTITRIGNIADPESNLLNGLYSISGLSLNGKAVTSSTSIVEKQMVFKTTATYLLDNNEPKVILSPRLLRIPNSSYKLLGYIPDISGHGNHGVIHNSAYSGDSGADGIKICNFYISNYLIDGKAIADKLNNTMSFLNDDSVSIIANPGEATVGGGKARVTGMKSNSRITFYASYPYLVITKDGIYDIPYADADATSIDLMSWSNCKGVTIESLGKYEGAYCLDGVDDFVTIPTVTGGGKQVFMKIYNNTINSMLYDQRSAGTSPNSLYNDFAIYCTNSADNNQIAYQSRLVGNTYIDGILNTNITCEDLLGVLHNITITCDIVAPNNGVVPNIGRGGVLKDLYSNMALYDFMLFDEISTDDKIKELNEYVGIEAKVELPPYYWDAYGKTNLDEDKATIQQRGVAVGDYDLTNTNFAYDKMSGYGGYAFAKFDNTSEWIYTNNSDTIEVVNRDGYDVVLRKVGNGTNYWHFRNTIIKSLGQDIQIGVYANKSVQIVWQLKYKLEGETDYNTLAIASPTIEGNINTYVTLPYKTEQEIADLNAVDTYYSIYFIPIDLDINEEVTIEMLPLYPNGLVYDGVTDYSENVNIPALTDYTYIFKRRLLNDSVNRASMNKGLTDQQRATVIDFSNSNGNIEGYSFGNGIPVSSLKDSDIIYGTTNSVNGTNIIKGSNPDSIGINISKFASYYKQMIFYKLMLYPKTIPLLQINFLKNLMEKDEIIDLNNKIFIQE